MTNTTKTREQLKSYFVTNAIPTEDNFHDLIDAPLNQADDGVFKLPNEPLSVSAVADPQKRVLRFHPPGAAKPDWLLSLNPQRNPVDPATARPGLGFSDGAGNLRLFIEAGTGNVGLGTNTIGKKDRLTVADGDVCITGGFYRRLKIISDEYWSGIDLVARQQGERGTDAHPHIDFTHGDLDAPNYGVRVWAADNNTLRVQAGSGALNLWVNGDVKAEGKLSVSGDVVLAKGALRAADVALGEELRRLDRIVPIGTVIPWWRPSDQIPLPAGFEVCDGRAVKAGEHGFKRQDGTAWDAAIALPDLRNAFVLGADPAAGAGAAIRGPGPDQGPGVGGKGGSNDPRTIEHAHSVSLNHTHAAASTGDASLANGRTGGAGVLKTSWVADHSHPVGAQTLAWSDHAQDGSIPTLTNPKNLWIPVMPAHNTHGAGGHDHAISDHNHDVRHTHGIPALGHSGSVNSSGVASGPKSVDILPRYVGLIMIMRVR